jgi:hypothetical protein
MHFSKHRASSRHPYQHVDVEVQDRLKHMKGLPVTVPESLEAGAYIGQAPCVSQRAKA